MSSRISESSMTGASAAAMLAAGIGCFALGIMVILAEASAGISAALRFSMPVGPLSGKTIVAVVVWLIAWVVLHVMWKDSEREVSGVFTATLVLIALGFLATFPIFFDMFAPAG